jgi:hypothetical protein
MTSQEDGADGKQGERGAKTVQEHRAEQHAEGAGVDRMPGNRVRPVGSQLVACPRDVR